MTALPLDLYDDPHPVPPPAYTRGDRVTLDDGREGRVLFGRWRGDVWALRVQVGRVCVWVRAWQIVGEG